MVALVTGHVTGFIVWQFLQNTDQQRINLSLVRVDFGRDDAESSHKQFKIKSCSDNLLHNKQAEQTATDSRGLE